MILPNFDPRQSEELEFEDSYPVCTDRDVCRGLLAVAAAGSILAGAVMASTTRSETHDQLRFVTSVDGREVSFAVSTQYSDTISDAPQGRTLLAGHVQCSPVAEDQPPAIDILAYNGSRYSENYLAFVGQVGKVCQIDGNVAPLPDEGISSTVFITGVLDGLYAK